MKKYTRNQLSKKMHKLGLHWVFAMTGGKDRSRIGNLFVAMAPVVLGAQGNSTVGKWRCVRAGGGRDSLWVRVV